MFKEEIKSLQTLKSKLMHRISELEEELKTSKEEAEKLAKCNKSDDEVSDLRCNRCSSQKYTMPKICGILVMGNFKRRGGGKQGVGSYTLLPRV